MRERRGDWDAGDRDEGWSLCTRGDQVRERKTGWASRGRAEPGAFQGSCSGTF